MGASLPPVSEEDDAARAPRSARLFATHMRISGQSDMAVTVRNVSRTGVGLRTDYPPAPGTVVTILLGQFGDVEGCVRWRDGRLFGVALTKEIEPESFNFAGKSWSKVAQIDGSGIVFDCFRPETSTYRPGFRVR